MKPAPSAPEQAQAPAPPAPRADLPSAAQASDDPLVKAVIEAFDGEVTRVYPRPQGS